MKRTTRKHPAPALDAATVLHCWRIARHQAEVYQRAAHRARRDGKHQMICLAKRDAADRIALTIRYGKRRRRKR